MRKILIIILAFLSMTKVYACSCQNPGTVEEAFNYTQTIVHGKVLGKSFVSFAKTMTEEKANTWKAALKPHKRKLQLFESDFIIKVKLEVRKTFKGHVKRDTITIFTTRTGASCGFTGFEIGKEYLVYASSRTYTHLIFNLNGITGKTELEHTFWTNHCTRTTVYHDSEAQELTKLSNK